MKKKLISIILATALLLSAAGCGGNTSGAEVPENSITESENASAPKETEQEKRRKAIAVPKRSKSH